MAMRRILSVGGGALKRRSSKKQKETETATASPAVATNKLARSKSTPLDSVTLAPGAPKLAPCAPKLAPCAPKLDSGSSSASARAGGDEPAGGAPLLELKTPPPLKKALAQGPEPAEPRTPLAELRGKLAAAERSGNAQVTLRLADARVLLAMLEERSSSTSDLRKPLDASRERSAGEELEGALAAARQAARASAAAATPSPAQLPLLLSPPEPEAESSGSVDMPTLEEYWNMPDAEDEVNQASASIAAPAWERLAVPFA